MDLELRVMSVCSRTVGGMRVSDLLAWTWDQIDLEQWVTAYVPRPQTRRAAKRVVEQRHALPEVAVRFLKEWWMSRGRPVSGPVFTQRRRRRICMGVLGQKRERGSGYAERLRKALLTAGVKRDALPHDTPTRLAVDFHSFRRAYCTALGGSGVNAQTSMALAGHSSMITHQRHVLLSEALVVPAAAIPTITAPPAKDAASGL